jgi:hypothetical protein
LVEPVRKNGAYAGRSSAKSADGSGPLIPRASCG